MKKLNMNVKPIPEGFNSLSVYLSVKGAEKAIEFYERAFGALEVGRITMPDGSIGHAELQIGDSRIMLAEENKTWGNLSPATIGGSPVTICLYVPDVDLVFDRALKAGAQINGNMAVKDQFHGDRSGSLVDPFGYKWAIVTHIEDLSFDELQVRSDALFKQP